MEITSEFCRICLTNSAIFNEETKAFDSFSIYKKDENNLSFADKLQHLTKLSIPRNIPLAKRICKSCCVELNSSYNFIKQCEENERIIQKYLEKNLVYQQQDKDFTKISSDLQNSLYQEHFQESGKDDAGTKEQIEITPSIFEDNSFFLTSGNDNENTDDNNDFQNEDNDECNLDQKVIEKTKPIIEKPSPIKKIKCESDYDKDFSIDDIEETSSDSDGSDSDYGSKAKKPNIKMISSNKSKIIKLPQSNMTSRVIKLNLIRSTKLKTENKIAEEDLKIENIEENPTKDIENDQKIDHELPKAKNSIKISILRNRRNKKMGNLKRKNKNLKSKQSNLKICKATVCPICGKTYKCGDTMNGHIKWHENNEEYFKCDICDKGFDNLTYLKRHKKIHSKRPTPYTCEICGKSFSHSNKLRKHIQFSHTEDRLKCPHCDITVKYPSSLKRHLFTHNDIKNYECVDCSKTFRSRSNLNQHLESNFHVTKDTLPVIRVKGITQQYVPGQSKPSYRKNRKLQIKKENNSGENQIPQEQSIESAEHSHITYEHDNNETQLSGNYLIKSFAQFLGKNIE